MPTSDFGWFFLGFFAGATAFGLLLTFIEAKWHWISNREVNPK